MNGHYIVNMIKINLRHEKEHDPPKQQNLTSFRGKHRAKLTKDINRIDL